MARVIVIIISTVLLNYQEIKTSGRNRKLSQHKLQLQLLPLNMLDEMEYMRSTKPELGFSGSDLLFLQINLDHLQCI